MAVREEAMEVDMRVSSPMIVSPTALTNAIRRGDNGRQGAPGTTTFLAAEHFQGIPAPAALGGVNKAVPPQYSIPFVETVESEGEIEFHSVDEKSKGSFEGCKAPLMRRPKSCGEAKDVAFEVKAVALSGPVQTAVKEQYLKPAQDKTVLVMKNIQIKAKQAQKKAVEMKPDEDQVRGCMRETRATGDKVARYANLVYDMFAQECQPDAVRGDPRGDDSMFFRYGSQSTRASPAEESRMGRPFSPMASSSPRSTPTDAFRSPKSMRYPQAAKIENPVERSERKKKKKSPRDRRDSSEETREDTTESSDESFDLGDVMNHGDDQASLREVRLQMYKGDDGSETIPKARLGRALGQLSAQDQTIESLQTKLEDTKLLLQEKESRLGDAQTLCRKHERKIQELMAKASEDKRTLETKIAREAQAKGKLQSKVDVLQKEIFRLKAALGETNDTYTWASQSKASIPRVDTYESGTDGEVWEGIVSEDDENTAVEVSLRAEIVSLKSQLADSQAENQSVSSRNTGSKGSDKSRGGMYMSPDSTDDEISNLRQKLNAAEAELAALRQAKQQNQATEENVAALEKKLAAAEEEFRESTRQLEETEGREANLLKELEVARERITQLENERSARQMDSLEETEDLKLLYANDSKESEVAKNKALADLEQSRAEVDELRTEVKNLTETIHEMSQNSVVLTEERLKERDRLEEALHRCKTTEHQLRDRILDLEQQLEKAQTSTLQLIETPSDEGRSVKRKLDESISSDSGALVTRESVHHEERLELKEQLRRSQATEQKLRSEMAITRQLLHCAEKVVAEMDYEMNEDSRQRGDNESRIMSELNDLREKLEKSEARNREIVAAQEKTAVDRSINDKVLQESEEKQQALLNQINVLKVSLESVEIERRKEKMEMIEERRIHEDLESKRIKEIDSLRVELANVRAKADKSKELQAEVDDLRVRLANVRVASEELKRRASLENQKKDEVSKKLKSEMSVVKQRLAAIRKRNATRRQREARRKNPAKNYGSSSTDDLSSSGESEHSFVFSSPSFPSSPDRQTTTSSMASGSPSFDIRKSALRTSPSWASSPDRPLGSFPSPPRQRVDVSSLRQRLAESNQRLQDANSRLSGLAETTDSMAQEQFRAENLSDEISTLVAEHSDFSDPTLPPEKAFHKMVQGRMVATEKKTVRWPGTEEGSI